MKSWPPPVVGRIQAGFSVREIPVGPLEECVYDEADWRDALVIVERGTIELEWVHGARRQFVEGDPLSLSPLGLKLLRNPGPVPAVLSATSRNRLR